MIAAGIDSGSVATKVVVLRDSAVLARSAMPTGARPRMAAESALRDALRQAGLARARLARIVATGYGRRALDIDGEVVTEITAAARGAHWIGCPSGPVRTVVDLGGQDTKVIVLDPDGSVSDFAMNDKCAAGTGRFLSLMAAALEVDLSEMGELAARSTSPVGLNSTCAVFAESEVISLIAQGRSKEDIAAGLHASIALRISAMVKQMGGGEVFFAGGGARNGGVRDALEKALGRPVYVPPEPQFVVATGAAILALRNH